MAEGSFAKSTKQLRAFSDASGSRAGTAGAVVKTKELFRPDMEIKVPISDEVLRSQSLSTANSQELLKYKVGNHVKTFKRHPSDTGNSAVQSKFSFIL